MTDKVKEVIERIKNAREHIRLIICTHNPLEDNQKIAIEDLEEVLALLKEPKCETCGSCKHNLYCTHERKTAHNKNGECSDWQSIDKQPKAGEFTKEWIAEQIGIGIHTSLRKFTESNEAMFAYKAIEKVPDKEWNNVCNIVAEIIYEGLCDKLDTAEAELAEAKERIEGLGKLLGRTIPHILLSKLRGTVKLHKEIEQAFKKGE